MSTTLQEEKKELMEHYEIIKWAEQLANKYEMGIAAIINSFVEARKELGTNEAAKEFIEKEMSCMRRG